MSRLGWFGVILTVVYITGFCWLFQPQISQLDTLKPNELGDFLAGVFGPVALFWVVLGFFQQGAELKNSVETLKLQATELRNSVEQQRELVKASRDQIELDRETISYQREQSSREIRPVFVVSESGGHATGIGRVYRIDILNKGEIASDIKIEITPNTFTPNKFHIPSISRGSKNTIEINLFENTPKFEECMMCIECSRKDGILFKENYLISLIENARNRFIRKIKITKIDSDTT